MKTYSISVFGVVQGVGFRPFVCRTARELAIKGQVCNKGAYVEILLQGTEKQKNTFLTVLKAEAPERAVILKIDTMEVQKEPYASFEIVESEKEGGTVLVSPDIGVCPTCQKELTDPANRRYQHPFINCTSCGPRLTILESMPYDRERTSMKEFPMCEKCAAEYKDPTSRRYDAQPVCCPDCGPQVYLLDRAERGRDAISAARRAIAAGKIIAVKGLGGFHLCCDATDETATARLRTLKHRPVKPFAVMMRDSSAVKNACYITDKQQEVLEGYQKPIMLLKRRTDSRLAPSVAPHNPQVGVFLPYTPLHMLLFTYDDGVQVPPALVMTSANVSGAPICRTEEDIRQEMLSCCDLVLSHDRKIRLRADDSVMDWYDNRPYMIRRSRGYAPLPVFAGKGRKKQVLAVGGELKNSFCIGKDNLFYLSPYIGDMSDMRTVAVLKESMRRFSSLLAAKPAIAACDLHPQYNSRQVAEESGLPVVPVQHHYAHVLSCMAENNYMDKVIGVAFDGTGYGTDGTIWGGEVLLCDPKSFVRYTSVPPFKQCGGDAAAREGWRIAVNLLYDFYGEKEREKAEALMEELHLASSEERRAQLYMATERVNTVTSTSVGRLFDAVSAILGICRESTFEGEAAMRLQFVAEKWPAEEYSFGFEFMPKPLCKRGSFRVMNFAEAWKDVLDDIEMECSIEETAYRFHVSVAEMVAGACMTARQETGIKVAALTGGVFQNRLLLRLCEEVLQENGFNVLTHSLIPPNDGGLALGQAVHAMYRE